MVWILLLILFLLIDLKMRKVETSFSAEFALVKNERDIALKRLELLKRDLVRLKCNSVSADVSFAADDLLEWFDVLVLLDEDFKNVR